MPRRVTLRLVDAAGRGQGVLAPFPVESPWWQETGPVVSGARRHHGVEVRVLHIVDGVPDDPAQPTAGGSVEYLAELLAGPAAGDGEPEPDEPLRPLWARPGGVARILDWADGVLRSLGRPRTGPAVQYRAWNLSSILRLDTAHGPVWCKSVPHFFAHEGPAISYLCGLAPDGMVPRLLGHDPATASVLLEDIPGRDLYDCDESSARAMIPLLVELQHRTAGKLERLRGIGLPDWRGDAFVAAAGKLSARPDLGLAATERDALANRVAELPQRFAALADCGLPDTLVHGDPHPGNWRSDGHSLVLLDWGDCGVGNPLFDCVVFTDRTAHRLRDDFVAEWRNRLPGADPATALRLLAPVAALRQALIYQTFLDGIEPAERIYHRADVPYWLRRAIRPG